MAPSEKSASRKRKQSEPDCTANPPVVVPLSPSGRPVRACSLKMQKTSHEAAAAQEPMDRLALRSNAYQRDLYSLYFPRITPESGFPMALAQVLNPRLSLDGWWERVFKANLRRYAARKKSGGSAFTYDSKQQFKGKIWMLEEGYVASNHCRTMHRISTYPGVGKQGRLKQLYTSSKTDTLPKDVHSTLFMTRNLGRSGLRDDSSSLGLLSDWTKEPINQTDILITAERSVKLDNYLRVASVPTGIEHLTIWLSSGDLMYKDVDFFSGYQRICVCSNHDKDKSLGGGFIMLFWNLFPFRYGGGFRVSETVFGKTVSSVGDFGDILIVSRQKQLGVNHTIDLYDLRPAMLSVQAYDVKVGDRWDQARFPFSSSGTLPTDRSMPIEYGRDGCGMPLSYTFTECPTLLHTVQTSDSFLHSTMRRGLILVADAKLEQFKLMDLKTKEQVPGPILQTRNIEMKPEIVAENVLMIESDPERFAIWTGTHVKVYGLSPAKPAGGAETAVKSRFELREDFSFSPPTELPGCDTPEWDAEPVLSYDYTTDVLIILFRDWDSGVRVVKLVDGQSGAVLSTTVLKGKVPQDAMETITLDEYGLIHTHQGKGPSVMMFYSMTDSTSLD